MMLHVPIYARISRVGGRIGRRSAMSYNDQIQSYLHDRLHPKADTGYSNAMEKARFERSLVHQYMPLNPAAWLAYVAFAVLEVPLMLAAVVLDLNVIAWWCISSIAFALFLGFWAFAHWRSDDR